MRRRLGTLAAIAALLTTISAGPAPAAEAAERQRCGTVSGGVALYDIRARGVGCRYARRTARAWRRAVLADRCRDGRFRCRARGYRCRARPPAEIHYKVRCRRDAKRVTWWIHAD